MYVYLSRDTAINSKLLEEKIVTSKQQIMQLQARCEDIAYYQAKADQYKVFNPLSHIAQTYVILEIYATALCCIRM